MRPVIVVDDPTRFRLTVESAEIVAAREYLADPSFAERRGLVVFNLCRSYAYQSAGYYVSLLAEARGHRARPGIAAMQDMRAQGLTRSAAADLSDVIERALRPLQSDEFTLSIYFGRCHGKRYARLAVMLFNQFEAPLLRARFVRSGEDWTLQQIGPMAVNAVPPGHFDLLEEAAREYFEGRIPATRSRKPARYRMAVLTDAADPSPPSDDRALDRFAAACKRRGFAVDYLDRNDFARVGEYDALFIRTTTAVDHFTYRFARRAAMRGLAVIDDPLSIVRCSNKAWLAEALHRQRIPTPNTMVVHPDDRSQVSERIGLPLVLKQPDGSHSRGVVKIDDGPGLEAELDRMFADSELVIAQEFTPTEFDWRIGVLGGEPLYACRYFMADRHWQIVRYGERGGSYGKVETIPVDLVPPKVIRLAVRAARLFGEGLYGVDLKQAGNDVKVIEVNDNPNLNSGFEDRVLGTELWNRLADWFASRIEASWR